MKLVQGKQKDRKPRRLKVLILGAAAAAAVTVAVFSGQRLFVEERFSAGKTASQPRPTQLITKYPFPELDEGRVVVAIINGDPYAKRHRDNPSHAISALTSRGVKPGDIFVAGRFTKKINVNEFSGTPEGVRKMFSAVTSAIKQGETLLLYITGYGSRNGIVLENGTLNHSDFLKTLKKFFSNKIIFVADCCFSGVLPDRIMQPGLNAVAMSPGVVGKETSCHFFAKPFWNAVEYGIDMNGDKISTFEEIFRYSIEAYRRRGKDTPYGSFRRSLPEIVDAKQLESGNVLLEIRTSWCSACNKMEKPLNAFSMMVGGSANVYTIDWEKNPLVGSVRKKLPKVTTFPTFVFLKNGRLVAVKKGAMDVSTLFGKAEQCFGIGINKTTIFEKQLQELSSRNDDVVISGLKKIGFLVSHQREFELFFRKYLVLSERKNPRIRSALREALLNILDSAYKEKHLPLSDTMGGEGVTFALNIFDISFVLVDAMKDENKDIRYKAAFRLSELGDLRSLPVLIDATTDQDANIRVDALWGLAIVRKRATGKTRDDIDSIMIEMLKDPNKKVWDTAGSLLWGAGKDSYPQLFEALKHGNPWVRLGAARALLGREVEQKAVPVIIKELGSEDGSIRYEAAEILGKSKSDSVFPALLEALRSPNVNVRKYAAFALSMRKDQRAVSALINALDDADCYVRVNSMWALAAIGDERAIPPLLKILNNIERAPRVSREKKISPALQKIADERNLLRYVAKKALEKIKTKAASSKSQ